MKNFRLIVSMIIMLATLTTANAAKGNGNTVAYTVLRNYFHNNDAPIPQSPLITNQKDFDAQFGMATHMGKDGQPTKVNFKKQAVLAIVLPETTKATDIDSVSVKVSGKNELTLAYTVHEGVENGYATQPIQLMAIDKKYKGYTVKTVPTIRQEVTVTTGGYEYVSLNDVRHDIRLSIDYPVDGKMAIVDSLRTYIGNRLAALAACFKPANDGQTNVANNYTGRPDGKALLQYHAANMAFYIDNMNQAAGLNENRCAMIADIHRVYENDRYVSYEANGYFTTGGAHGMSFCDGATFDKATGKRLTLVKGAPDLMKLVTKRLHQYNEGVEHFSQEPVPMPQAAPYLTGDGKIKFIYQPYEIGAYAIGKPECEFYPYEIEDYLTSEGKGVMQ